mmetsp:Transcript_12385/g.18782  ORF Transcript_12385/g.18782 Transcript_12385/m.18782 type:complete len:233 (+) Transcript_12385:52-750(+)
MMRPLLFGGSAALVGVWTGAKYHEEVKLAKSSVGFKLNEMLIDIGFMDREVEYKPDYLRDGDSLMRAAIGQARSSGKYAVLSTQAGDNTIASRMIQPLSVEFDKTTGHPTVYFTTNKLSRKVNEMKACPKVTLTFLDQKKMSCLSIVGSVERVPYPESAEYWNESLRIFYPEGGDESKGSRFTLWKLSPRTMQLVNASNDVVSTRDDWRPLEVECVDGENTWEITCTGKDNR